MSSEPSKTRVLVTGGSGYIGSYVILALLAEGFTVRTTVRNLSREAEVRSYLSEGGATQDQLSRLSFVAASLEHDNGWAEAVQDCDYIQHVASPVPAVLPKDENELIVPALEGTLRVLKAATKAKVKRVVVTGSVASISAGHGRSKFEFTEEDWAILDDPRQTVFAYPKAKTLAERAAWEFVKSDANTDKMELSFINPVFVLGPVLGKDSSASVLIISRLLDGSFPAYPDLGFTFIDVRDVASLQLSAMVTPEAAGQRFIAGNSDGCITFQQLGSIVKRVRPEHAKKVPRFQLPLLAVKIFSYFDKQLAQVVPDLGLRVIYHNDKARRTFGWQPRTIETTVADTVDSLLKYGKTPPS